MAAGGLDGEKLSELAGTVKWTTFDSFSRAFEPGSIALYQLSNSFYVHATAVKGRQPRKVKFLLRQGKFTVSSRETRLTLSIPKDIEKKSSGVSITLQDANPQQLCGFLNSLNIVRTSTAPIKAKFSAFTSTQAKGSSIQDIENQPCISNGQAAATATSTRALTLQPTRYSLSKSSSTNSPQKASPNLHTSYHAKQMKPPSSYGTQKKKSPLHDRTFASENLSNTSSSRKSAVSFYGSNRSALSPRESKITNAWTLKPGLLPPPQTKYIAPNLARQISFRSRDKHLFENEVTLTGFSNLGNTCYMNAILQSLLGVPPFVQDLSNKCLLEKVHPDCLYKCLYGVMSCKKKSGNREVLKSSLRKLKKTISEAATRFSGYHQHDAHEFLCQVFDQLKDDISLCASPLSNDTGKDSSKEIEESLCPVTRSFECGVMHTISCKQCAESVTKEEVYHAFSLDIPTLCLASGTSPFGAINMQTLLEKYFQDEELEYTCGKCECKEAIISHSFSRLPRVVILHLKRYGYNNATDEQAKKQDKINIERFIDLRKLCTVKTKAPLEFYSRPLKLSPVKSSHKRHKRPLVESEEETSDFCPSPPVRRKLDHSFLTTLYTSTNPKTSIPTSSRSLSDKQVVVQDSPTKPSGKIDTTERTSDIDFTDSEIEDKENNEQLRGNGKAVWEASEEEQMRWALEESAKNTASVIESIDEVQGKRVEDSSDIPCKLSRNVTNCVDSGGIDNKNVELGVDLEDMSWASAESTENKQGNYSTLSDDQKASDSFPASVHMAAISCHDPLANSGVTGKKMTGQLVENTKAVWEASEEEQIKWAMAESAVSSDSHIGEVRTSNQDIKFAETVSDSQRFIKEHNEYLISNDDVSDEDLINGEEDNCPDQMGLKGGSPITMQNFQMDVNTSDDLVVSPNRNDSVSNKGTGEDSSPGKSPAVVLKNSPILCVKRPNGRVCRKKKELNAAMKDKQPVLSKFDGSLFESSQKEEVDSSTKDFLSPIRQCNSWTTFSNNDIEKAISLSLKDQQMQSNEDDDLNRALKLSLQEYEENQPVLEELIPPVEESVDSITDKDSSDDIEKLSTHSYRLISIVSHLGSRSTSGHYISDVYDCKAKQWTSYDDSTATKVSEHGVRYKRQQTGYIFFYLYKQCVDSLEGPSPRKTPR